jgi:hypothetical protein
LSPRTDNIQGNLLSFGSGSFILPLTVWFQEGGTRATKKNTQLGASYLQCTPNIIGVIKARWVRWAVYVARMGEEEKLVQGFGVQNVKERDF